MDSCATSIPTALLVGRHAEPRFVDFEITAHGPLTEDEKDKIFDLAERRHLGAWTIGKRLGRHPSTVAWYLTKIGLKRLAPTRKQPFLRQGRIVIPFSAAEDAYLLRRSLEGALPCQIKREMDARFPHPRSRDTIACRLQMLASDEAAREAA